MQLHAALLPPLHVRQALEVVVRGVAVPSAQPTASTGGRWRLGRGRERAGAPAGRPELVSHQLSHVSVADMHVSLATFGMVTRGDSRRLVEALAQGVGQRGDEVTVRIDGGAALEFPGDQSVWAKLGGDTAGLTQLARNVTGSVERIGMFVDRRRFRPWLRVGTVTDATTEEYLTQLLAALDNHTSEPWSVECISLMRRSFGSGGPGSEELERIAL